ncbi:MAG: MBL fold metallo-hydrolase [Clostridia bacterium]|nr:MBL fold metallo-hydrolase [Clostridia bacterium]
MKSLMLGSKKYKESTEHDYGDCVITDTGNNVIVFDCGSEEHAKEVIKYLEDNYNTEKKAIVVLSHNDSDHFNGIPMLVEQNRIESVYTILPLKFYDELLEEIDDDRKTKDSIKRQILERYSNITSLNNKGILKNIYNEDNSLVKICDGVKIVGPSKEYALEVIGKALDSRQGDTIDSESVINAASVQLSIDLSNSMLLLTGDASIEAISENAKNHQIIQIPHHGRLDHAEDLFNIKKDDKDTVFLISDNKGSNPGGSRELIKQKKDKGHVVLNTRLEDTLELTSRTYQKSQRMGSYI